MTIVLTTHYMDEAEQLCDRIAIIDNGKIVALDSPEKLIRTIGGDIVQLRGGLHLEELKKLPFVKEIKNIDQSYYISVENAAKNLQRLLSVAGNVEFVEVHSPNLNDVFLHYTGKAMREEEGDTIEQLRSFNRAIENK
jgi:ABC-2 type transport system ATP-binding protein